MSPLGVDEGFYLELSLKGYLANNFSQNLFQLAMNFQRIHLKIWPKNGMFSFKVFLPVWVIAAGEKEAEKKSILARKR